jgi:hypothetical protein
MLVRAESSVGVAAAVALVADDVEPFVELNVDLVAVVKRFCDLVPALLVVTLRAGHPATSDVGEGRPACALQRADGDGGVGSVVLRSIVTR